MTNLRRIGQMALGSDTWGVTRSIKSSQRGRFGLNHLLFFAHSDPLLSRYGNVLLLSLTVVVGGLAIGFKPAEGVIEAGLYDLKRS
jgi:hypothetical protein